MKLASKADAIAKALARKPQQSFYWPVIRDCCDLETAGDLDCKPLDLLTDMVAKRLERRGTKVTYVMLPETRKTIDIPHPHPARDCPTCGGSGIEEMKVTDAGKVDITCRACLAEEKECDVCGEMKPSVALIHVYHAGDTSACDDCRNTQQ